ncbi:MAG: thiol:disulfide interchange protein DsbA/DsbL [Rhodocyclaceae bacterium]
MKRRNVLQLLAAAAFAMSVAPWAVAQVAGKDYTPISPAQPGGSNGQIEIVEFFSYGCPHCYEFDPLLSKWRARQPADVVFHRVPISFGNPKWADLQRVFLTLQAMKISDKYDTAVFEGVHKQRIDFSNEKQRNDWLTAQGIDVKTFNDTWRSFGVNAQVKRSEQLAELYKIQGVPSMAVDGRFMAAGNSHEELLRNTDLLINKARLEKGKK